MPEDHRSTTTGGLLKFSVALPPELVAELDEIAREQHSSRNAALRQLVDLGMEQRRRQLVAIEAVA